MTETEQSGGGVLQARRMNELRVGAARERLANCAGQADAIEGVREIVSNFLGSEEMTLFDVRSGEPRTLWSFGADAGKCDLLKTLGAKGLRSVIRGECQLENVSKDRARSAGRVQAFVPLRLEGQTVGVLAILQLLPQKAGFDAADMDLLKLLSDEAGKSLFDSADRQNK